jgi:hypothetical protein
MSLMKVVIEYTTPKHLSTDGFSSTTIPAVINNNREQPARFDFVRKTKSKVEAQGREQAGSKIKLETQVWKTLATFTI